MIWLILFFGIVNIYMVWRGLANLFEVWCKLNVIQEDLLRLRREMKK